MFKLTYYLTSLFLIFIILARLPQETTGFNSFATKLDILGSPSSARRILNILTLIGILVYLGIAIQLNLNQL